MADTEAAKTWTEVRAAEKAHLNNYDDKKQPIGLALSGGGIRAATFSLGVLQALAEKNLLSKFHYMSTVSGGGYIGSWLSALIKRQGGGDVHAAEKILASNPRVPTAPAEDVSISFLRRYSNYLTPQVGMLSVDTWTAIVIYTRNLMINLTVLFALAVSLILLVHFFIALGAEYLGGATVGASTSTPEQAIWLGVGWLAVLAVTVGWRIGRRRAANEPSSQKEVMFFAVLPSYAAAVCWAFGFGELATLGGEVLWWKPVLWCTVLSAALVIVAQLVRWWDERRLQRLAGAPARAGASPALRGLEQEDDGRRWYALPSFGALAGAVAGVLLWAYLSMMAPNGALGAFIAPITVDTWLASLVTVPHPSAPGIARNYLISAFHLALGTLVMLIVFATAVMALIGLAKRYMSESDREWFARLGAWLYVGGGVWCVVFAIVALGPGLVIWFKANFPILASSGALLWIAQTAGALILGKSAISGGREPAKPWLEKLLSFAPYIFIIGVMFILAYGVDRTLIHINNPGFTGIMDTYCDDVKTRAAQGAGTRTTVSENTSKAGTQEVVALTTPTAAANPDLHCDALNRTISLPLAGVASSNHPALMMLAAFAVALLLGVFLAWRVDVNLFSFERFYRNRLARCYLGASRVNEPDGRGADPFTDLAAEDDLYLAELQDPKQRPFHIINTTLNITAPRELNFQERKGASFTMTPLHCGFALPGTEHLASASNDSGMGYRNTEAYARGTVRGSSSATLESGATLGMAMSTSGAAASSSMGHNSTAALSLLLTVFNVRLGRWVGNPTQAAVWRERAPSFGLGYLIAELFGDIDHQSNFVYLSDGGHFENLGVYELVRRRCAMIVVTSCGQDADYVFDDLANAIRLCQIDFGISIEIEPRHIKPDENRISKTQFAIGRIRYSALNEGLSDGYIAYIKPAITARTSVDIRHYQSQHKDFPQETTLNQWYTESQFESYRKLGLETGREVFAARSPVRAAFDGLA